MEQLNGGSVLVQYSNSNVLSWNTTCADNCSGHGECHNGTCVCEIQFDGEECSTTNISYFVGFASTFFALALVCLIQLVMCIVAEWQRMKAPSLLHACRITTQKLLYFVVFLASIIRGAYFTSPTAFADGWSSSLMTAYYPLLLSGSSLVVCFWAEVFHLRDIRWEKPQFLSKSFLAFVTFNVISYSLLFAEFFVLQYLDINTELKIFYTHVFNGCYAVLLFIVVVFFLIYGVQVFFKVRGGFLIDETYNASRAFIKLHHSKARQLIHSARSIHHKTVDISQLQQSRLGLLSQALMLSIIIGFLCSETLSELWKTKVPLHSRNWHNLLFRTVEIGVALWFPCVLWNCMSPEQLWILNPKRIIKKLDNMDGQLQLDKSISDKSSAPYGEDDEESCFKEDDEECFICRSAERTDMGALIQPCQCRGDVKSVHHDCLKEWLIKSSNGTNWNLHNLECRVCCSNYRVERVKGKLDWQSGFTAEHWLHTAGIVTTMCLSAAGAWVIIQLFLDPVVRLLAAGSALLVEYVCIRFLSQNTMIAYQRAKISAFHIIGNNVSTISDTVTVEIPQTSSANI